MELTYTKNIKGAKVSEFRWVEFRGIVLELHEIVRNYTGLTIARK